MDDFHWMSDDEYERFFGSTSPIRSTVQKPFMSSVSIRTGSANGNVFWTLPRTKHHQKLFEMAGLYACGLQNFLDDFLKEKE